MNDPVVRVREVSREYADGSVLALDRVSFDASAAQVIAITGPSGCGKSTLLSLLGLLDQPSAGRIEVAGQDLARVRRPSAFRAATLGFVFQFHYLVPTMTLQENVESPMVALGVTRGERVLRAARLLEQVGLAHRARFLPSRVSGGERQRAAIARALVNAPPVILADEPTGNLDSGNGQRVMQMLTDHAHECGALVIVATHNPEIACGADRTIAMRDGRVVEDAVAPRLAIHGLRRQAPSTETPS